MRCRPDYPSTAFHNRSPDTPEKAALPEETTVTLAESPDIGFFSTTMRQGGDLRGVAEHDARPLVDLGTCVNRLGPPAEVGIALRAFATEKLCAHPYEAAEEFQSAYALYLRVDPAHLVVGRGISEFISILSEVLPVDQTAVIAPDYTEIVNGFPIHIPTSAPAVPDTAELRLRRVRKGMRQFRYVIMSNPCNPTGIQIAATDLIAACHDFPRSVLIVDESYVDFTADPTKSLLGCELINLVVLRSPSKIFGIAGARCGALWTRDGELRARVSARRLNWPISLLDCVAAVAALGATDRVSGLDWAATRTAHLLTCAARMDSLLREADIGVIPTAGAHYRFVATPYPHRVYELFLRHEFVVRPFDPAEPGRIAGVRIATPLDHEFNRFERAVRSPEPRALGFASAASPTTHTVVPIGARE